MFLDCDGDSLRDNLAVLDALRVVHHMSMRKRRTARNISNYRSVVFRVLVIQRCAGESNSMTFWEAVAISGFFVLIIAAIGTVEFMCFGLSLLVVILVVSTKDKWYG